MSPSVIRMIFSVSLGIIAAVIHPYITAGHISSLMLTIIFITIMAGGEALGAYAASLKKKDIKS
ncbi:hypothetical protein pEaSNUABM49_00428 [Erwinia phage pEa_SNUABM_49]|nr:hypothetical protein pEaSNUABM49_00428 [Erwinia phage pEa_SNUABM_49]